MKKLFILLPLVLVGLVVIWVAPAWTSEGTGETIRNGLVVLLTDYGADSVYVGALKGAIYSTFPEVRIDSITNSTPPFDVLAGAFLLAEGCSTYPKGTVFCCVVDPGVGSARRAIVIETRTGHFFVGPDNGLLSVVGEQLGVGEVREVTNRSLWRTGEPSPTFQGRDIFGPVAASLARGVPLEEVGPPIDDMVELDVPHSRVEQNVVAGEVIRADDYGNLITNIRATDLERIGGAPGDLFVVTVGDATWQAPLVRTYSEVEEGRRLLLVQSGGFIECAINKGDLAKTTGHGLHAPVRIATQKR